MLPDVSGEIEKAGEFTPARAKNAAPDPIVKGVVVGLSVSCQMFSNRVVRDNRSSIPSAAVRNNFCINLKMMGSAPLAGAQADGVLYGGMMDEDGYLLTFNPQTTLSNRDDNCSRMTLFAISQTINPGTFLRSGEPG